MAGQAGWYRAPGEEGLLRYWNGSVWTDHRQPAPAPEPVAPESVAPAPAPEPTPVPQTDWVQPAPSPSASGWDAPQLSTPASTWDEPSASSEPDWSMDQFEKQFAVANDSVLSFDPHLDSDSGSHQDTAASIAPTFAAPIAVPSFLEPLRPQAAPLTDVAAAALAAAALAPTTGSITALQATPIASPAPSIATSTQASASDHFASDEESLVLASKTLDPDPAAAAIADGVREDRNRKRVIGALRGIIGGVLLILIGVGAMVFLNAQSSAGAGDIKTVGIITSLGSKGGSCTPVARYAGRGGSFSATTATALTPCPVGLGQSVDVVYKLSNPSATGQIVTPNPIQQYIWAAPVVGVLVFIVSLITFVVRAGSIARGISLLRDGGKRRRRSLQGA